jgi:hypothetical protein
MVKVKGMLQVDQVERATVERRPRWWRIKGAEAKREFLLAVQASDYQKHPESLAASTKNTAIERASHRLKLGWITWRWPAFVNWRRGLSNPPQWVAKVIADQLRANAAADLALADAVEKAASSGPGQGRAGAVTLRKWHARQKMEREKEKAAEAALRAKIESEG